MQPSEIKATKGRAGLYIKPLDEKMTERGERIGSEKVNIIALLETAMGIENAFTIATASTRMDGLLLGAEDLTADLRCKRTKEGAEITYARGRVIMAARAASI